MIKHFLDLDQIDPSALRHMLDLGSKWRDPVLNAAPLPFAGKFMACIFEKPSTRTRVSFDVGMKQLGGEIVMMSPSETQLGRNESIADTARVLSGYVDMIMIRTNVEAHMLELAQYASVPVINGLTDKTHPCQIMADIMTIETHRGNIKGKKIAWIGDGNNMATSWIHAAVQFEFELVIGCPNDLTPPQSVLEWAKNKGNPIKITDDVMEAVAGADAVNTDVWVSMSDEKGADEEGSNEPAANHLLLPFQVNDRVMAEAKSDALFLHCLPAHRGEEVTASVIDGKQSVVWEEAHNRLHAQKGIMLWCMGF